MPTIQTLQPNVTRKKAIEHFSCGLPRRLRSAALGPIRLLADVYIPFHLFRIDITNSDRADTRVLGVDAVTGSLDPYDFGQGLDDATLMVIDTRNCLEPRLNQGQTARLSIDKTRRVLFSRGFFRMRDLKITATSISETLHVPYWVGFQGTDTKASLSVMDATRRRFEGIKVRRLLHDWLRQDWLHENRAGEKIVSHAQEYS